jgi:hypothetical protein
MRRIKFLIPFILLFFSCSKEKFNTEGGFYSATYEASSDHEGSQKNYKNSSVSVLLTEETKDSIRYNGISMLKKGRELTGVFPNFAIFGVGAPADVELKRNFFNEDIEGTFTTTINYSGQDYDLDGTIFLSGNF